MSGDDPHQSQILRCSSCNCRVALSECLELRSSQSWLGGKKTQTEMNTLYCAAEERNTCLPFILERPGIELGLGCVYMHAPPFTLNKYAIKIFA